MSLVLSNGDHSVNCGWTELLESAAKCRRKQWLFWLSEKACLKWILDKSSKSSFLYHSSNELHAANMEVFPLWQQQPCRIDEVKRTWSWEIMTSWRPPGELQDWAGFSNKVPPSKAKDQYCSRHFECRRSWVHFLPCSINTLSPLPETLECCCHSGSEVDNQNNTSNKQLQPSQ